MTGTDARPLGGSRELPVPLAEYAEQLLMGTGLDATEAVRVAAGELDVPPELSRIQQALRAGWQLEDLPS